MLKSKPNLEAIKTKYAQYPNILRFIDQQKRQRSWKVLQAYLAMEECDLCTHMGPHIKSFPDLDAKCKVTMDKWDALQLSPRV